MSTTFYVVFILSGLQTFISLATEFEEFGHGDYGLLPIIIYITMSLPHKLYLLFPIAGMIGCVIGLGQLASRSELIVMQTSSVSKGRIIWSVMRAAIVMILIALFFGEVIGPPAQHYAESQKAIAKSGGQALKTDQGTWIRNGLNFIHVQSILPDQGLQGITRYRFDKNHNLISAMYAKNATYKHHQWTLEGVSESKISEQGVVTSHFKSMPWDISVNPGLLALTKLTANAMSLHKLSKIIIYRRKHGLRADNYDLNFWKRIFVPLSSGVMIFLAIPFVFGPLRTVTMGLRIMSGTIVGFGFYILNEFFGPLSMVFNYPPILGAILPALLFGLVGYLLMLRV